MTDVLTAANLSKRYRRTMALDNCSFSVPAGRVVALVGPNGAGKSTLLRAAVGFTRPSAGELEVFGEPIQTKSATWLARVGYLDQNRPLIRGFRVHEMLRYGQARNIHWDQENAVAHLQALNIDLNARVQKLSGGQQAQVSLALCLGKRAELLLLDEPASALDPVAREDLLHGLAREVASNGTSVILSTHALSDVSAICDYIVILNHGGLLLADDVEYVQATHLLMTGPLAQAPPNSVRVIEERPAQRDVTYMVRTEGPVDSQGWQLDQPNLEEIVMAYLRSTSLDMGVHQ
jgi:ABC-2 type transport system ATP-binding protein